MESPYFNSNEKLFRLFEIFESHLNLKSQKDLDKEWVWSELHPAESFDYDKLRKLLHQLLVLGEDFMAQQIYDESPAHRTHYLLQMLHRKQLSGFINGAILSGLNELKKEPNRPGTYYYDLYSIEKYKYVLENLESARVQKVNIQKLNLTDIDHQLNCFYFAEKLKYFCLLLSWSKMTHVDKNVVFIPQIIAEIQDEKYRDIPAIAIYFQIYLTFTEPEDGVHFEKLKELIRKFIHFFPPEDGRDIMNSAINYTIQKQNLGQLQYSKDNFELWKQALEREIILINGELSHWAFKNIITLALRIGEFDWVARFIDDYGVKLNIDIKENSIYYNKALLHFYRKEYDRALPLLQKVQYDEVTYGLDAKSLLLATYYELDEYEVLSSFYDSFKLFVQRNKSITEDRKKRYLLLIKYTKSLTDIGSDNSKLDKLKKEIGVSHASSKQWLLAKVEELKA